MTNRNSTPSISVAPGDPRRPRPVPLAVWLGLAGAAVAALVLVFPGDGIKDYVRREVESGRAGIVTSYLRSLLSAQPGDWELHLLLAESHLSQREWDQAEAELHTARQLAADSPQAARRLLEIEGKIWNARLQDAREAAAKGRNQALRSLLMPRVQALFRRLQQAQHFSDWLALRRMLAQALAEAEADLPQQVAAWRAELAQMATPLQRLAYASAEEASEAARLALADSQPALAADLYARALGLCGHRASCLVHWRAAVSTRLASGAPQSAWPWAREILGDPAAYEAPRLGWELARVAAAAGQPRAAAAELARLWSNAELQDLWARDATDGDWLLAWQLSLGAGDLGLAERVAVRAIAAGQSPQWTQRLAQVMEWRGQPKDALLAWLAQWRRAADELAFAQVQRLGGMLYDDERLIEAWTLRRQRRPLDDEAVRQLAILYERIGRPDLALPLLQERVASARATDQEATWQLALAELLARMGQAPGALDAYDNALAGGLTKPQALGAADLALRAGDLPRAYRYLMTAATDAGAIRPEDQAFYSLLANVAWDLQENEQARSILSRLVDAGLEKPFEAAHWLMGLSETADPRWLPEAARLAARHPDNDEVRGQWQAAVFALGDERAWEDFWQKQKPPVRDRLGRDPDFLASRAAFWQRLGRRQLARDDLQTAVALRPADQDLQAGLLWLLVDGHDRTALQSWLPRLHGQVSNLQPDLRDAMAAAWLLLRKPKQALALMRPSLASRRNDPLWLLGYADALYQGGYESEARRVRGHAFGVLRSSLSAPDSPLLAAAAAPAAQANQQRFLASLTLAATEPESAQRRQAWARLLAQARAVRNWRLPQATPLRDTLGLWLLANGQSELARDWMWRQHAWKLTTPAYQSFAAALQLEDRSELATLLDDAAHIAHKESQRQGTAPASQPPHAQPVGPSGDIDPKDRLTALRYLQRVREAARDGNEMAQALPAGLPEDVGLLHAQDMVASADRIRMAASERPSRQLAVRAQQVWGRTHLNGGLRLEWQLDVRRLHSLDVANLSSQGHEWQRDAGINLSGTAPMGKWQIGLGVADGPATHGTLRLRWEHRLTPASTLALEAALAERCSENDLMRLAGRQDRLQAMFTLQANTKLELASELQWTRLSTAWGRPQGQAFSLRGAGFYYLRRDPADWRMGLEFDWRHARPNGQTDPRASWLTPNGPPPGPAQFVGKSGLGLRLSTGWGLDHEPPDVYRRDPRAWAEASWSWSGRGEGGPSLRAGLRGSLLGRDQWRIGTYWDGTGAGRPRHGWQIHYELLFD